MLAELHAPRKEVDWRGFSGHRRFGEFGVSALLQAGERRVREGRDQGECEQAKHRERSVRGARRGHSEEENRSRRGAETAGRGAAQKGQRAAGHERQGAGHEDQAHHYHSNTKQKIGTLLMILS